jgi:UDP-N-acetyl-D-mannosaminuronic acid dehydrogenase
MTTSSSSIDAPDAVDDIDDDHFDLCVVGLGYIGLPTASMFATQGYDVLGVDIDDHVVRTVNDGDIHIDEPGLRTMVKAAVNSEQLRARTEPASADTFVIAVPTPSEERERGRLESDLSYIDQAVEAILPEIETGNLVLLESTSPPGTTIERVADRIASERNLKPGEDVYVAHCPERVLPGRILQELTQNDRVIGGVTESCARRAASLYEGVVDGDLHETGATTAELVKLMENTYRDVNIALANELANICDHLGVDVTRVVELANFHPRVELHHPGPGVGGHCLPIDPWFVVESAPEQSNLIQQARRLNQAVPRYLVDELESALDDVDSPKVALFGVAYKGNVDDAREAPARAFLELFDERHIAADVYDPHVRQFDRELTGFEEAISGADAIVVTAAHDEFKYLDPGGLTDLMRHHHLFDFCNHLDLQKWREAGFACRGRGVPSAET